MEHLGHIRIKLKPNTNWFIYGGSQTHIMDYNATWFTASSYVLAQSNVFIQFSVPDAN